MFRLTLLSLLLITWPVIAGEVVNSDQALSSVARDTNVHNLAQDTVAKTECVTSTCNEQIKPGQNNHERNKLEVTQNKTPTLLIPFIVLLSGLVIFIFLIKSPSDK